MVTGRKYRKVYANDTCNYLLFFFDVFYSCLPFLAGALATTQPVYYSTDAVTQYGSDLQSQLELNTSYMDYLEDAKIYIDARR